MGGKNMLFSVITMVWQRKHRVFVVECFIKTESYVAVQCTFCKKFKRERHYSVSSSVTIISKQTKIFQETSAATSVEVVQQTRSVWTVENCEKLKGRRDGTANSTSSTNFFVIFLTPYSTLSVKSWSSLSLLQTANCSRVERNKFCQIKGFLRTVFAIATTGRHGTFI